MISVTSFSGESKYINCDMIERIEETPDTLITLNNAHNLVVKESAAEVVDRIILFKRMCLIEKIELKTNLK